MSMVDFERLQAKEDAIAVVGLGYVGLPLAVALGRHFRCSAWTFPKSAWPS